MAMNRSILLGNERMTALKDTIKSLQDRSDCISTYCMSVCMYVLSHCVYVCMCMCVCVTRINMDNSKQCKLCSIDLLQKYCVLRYKADLSAYRRQALENNWQRHWVRTIHTYIHTYIDSTTHLKHCINHYHHCYYYHHHVLRIPLPPLPLPPPLLPLPCT